MSSSVGVHVVRKLDDDPNRDALQTRRKISRRRMTALIFERASHCAVFGAELSKDKIVKCININLLAYKLNKTHEGISEGCARNRSQTQVRYQE